MKGEADLLFCDARVSWCGVGEAGKKGVFCTSSQD